MMKQLIVALLLLAAPLTYATSYVLIPAPLWCVVNYCSPDEEAQAINLVRVKVVLANIVGSTAILVAPPEYDSAWPLHELDYYRLANNYMRSIPASAGYWIKEETPENIMRVLIRANRSIPLIPIIRPTRKAIADR